MTTLHPQYLIDERGEKVSVLLSINDFDSILKDLDELEDILLYDKAKMEREDLVSAENAFRIIETKRAENAL